MDLSQIKELVKKGESSTVEFKQSTSTLDKTGESLCALLNNLSGMVLIGISPKGKIVGQNVTDNTKQEIAAMLKKFEPAPTINIRYIEVDNKRQIIVLEVSQNNKLKPYFYNGRAYERIESTNSIMPLAKVQHLLLEREKQQNRWETWTAVGINLSDLDHGEIIKTLSEGVRLGRINPKEMTNDVNEILVKLGLLDKKTRELNNAAAVLFSNKLLPYYLQCTIHLARFRGITKTEFLDNKQITCHAFRMLDEAMTFINRHTSVSSKFVESKVERIDIPLFPPLAVREAVINAIAHRDYSIQGSSISIGIYDDRIEIESVGLLPNGINIDALWDIHRSNPRNELISHVLYLRGVIEQWGRGTNEIIRLCKEGNYKKPDFIEHHGNFLVRLWAKEKAGILEEGIKMKYRVNKRQQEILNVLTKFGALSSGEILAKMSKPIPDRTLRNDLSILRKSNLVDRRGEGRAIVWFVAEERE